MIVKIDKRFVKDIGQIKDQRLLNRVVSSIRQVIDADSLDSITAIRKMKGEGSYYRIRLGDYRIGLRFEQDTALFIRLLHRKEIYKYFP